MKKRKWKGQPIVSILLAVLLVLCMPANIPGQNVQAREKLQAGLNLDCARRYYTVKEIKRYICLIAGKDSPFIQLHLTDNENVGIECRMLGQTVKGARKNRDGSYTNPRTKKKFLSRTQIKELMRYAKKKKVALIPEIDMPSHMNGFFRLAEIKKGRKYVGRISADRRRYPGELRIGNKKAVSFAKELYGEYAELFGGSRYFHMGGDEYEADKKHVVHFINQMSRFLRKKGFVVRIWNDLILKKNLKSIDHRLQITYWSIDGDTQNKKERAKRRKVRASVPDLQRAGFSVLIYNSYYLYYVPSKHNLTKADREYMAEDLEKNWNLKVWDGKNGPRLRNTKYIIGGAVSIWGEDAKGVGSGSIYRQSKPLVKAFKKSFSF